MSAQYIMKKMPDIHGTGEEITYPQMVMTGQTGTRELAEYISAKCAFAKGVTEGVILELGEALAHEMAMGRSVKIEGIGVFSPALAGRRNPPEMSFGACSLASAPFFAKIRSGTTFGHSPEIPGRESVPHRTHLLPADRITEKFRYHGIA